MEIVNVMASSLDGKIGANNHEDDGQRIELGLSSDADRDFLKTEIATCDAIVVGASSIRANGECLDWPGRNGVPPPWFVFARDPIPCQLGFWHQNEVPRYLVSRVSLPFPKSTTVTPLVFSQGDLVLEFYQYLASQELEKVLLFGGGILNGLFYDRKLVDKLHLSVAPVLLGIEGAPTLVHGLSHGCVKLDVVSSHSHENFVFLKYLVRN